MIIRMFEAEQGNIIQASPLYEPQSELNDGILPDQPHVSDGNSNHSNM